MDAMWAKRGEYIAGKAGYEAIHIESVRMAHPAFPIFGCALATTPVLCNGARIKLWGSFDPIAAMCFNVNRSQTRKSRLAQMAEKLIRPVDIAVSKRLEMIWKLKALAEKAEKPTDEPGDEAAGERPQAAAGEHTSYSAFPGAWSVAYAGGTMERCKERCAGDFMQTKFTKKGGKFPALSTDAVKEKLPGATDAEIKMAGRSGMQGRLYFGQGLIFDEAYDILQELALLDKPGAKKTDDVASGQTPNAGWANRLLQSGRSDHETKTVGCHGGVGAPSVNAAAIGNLHPTPAVEMHKGLRGDHGCQTRARLLFTTGEPIQPHQAVDTVGDIVAKVEYFEIAEVLQVHLGFGDALKNVESAMKYFEPSTSSLDEEDLDAHIMEAVKLPFIPDEQGWEHELPDGVTTRVRMAWKDDKYVPEWALAVRDIDVPEGRDLYAAAGKLVAAFQKDHCDLDFDSKAKGAFLSYAAWFQIKVKLNRDKNNSSAAAEAGAAPWKLGMLSAMIFLWDMMWRDGEAAQAAAVPLLIAEEQVHRAYGLLEVFNAVSEGFRGDGDAPEPEKEQPRTDFNLEPRAQESAFLDSDVARRILLKGAAVRDGPDDQFEVSSRAAWSLFSKKELGKEDKFSVHFFRAVAKRCPEVIGKFDEELDALVFHVPADGEAAPSGYADALVGFANIKAEELIKKMRAKKLETRGGDKRSGGGGERRTSGAKKQKVGDA